MKIQIGIDDLCPRPTQSFELWHNVEKLLNAGLKVDLFVTFAMVRDGDGPYVLRNYPDFVERLKRVSENEDIALDVHGFLHSTDRNNNNDEFLYIDNSQLDAPLSLIVCLIYPLSMYFNKMFAPPACKIS